MNRNCLEEDLKRGPWYLIDVRGVVSFAAELAGHPSPEGEGGACAIGVPRARSSVRAGVAKRRHFQGRQTINPPPRIPGSEFESLQARHFGTELGTPKPAVFAPEAATSAGTARKRGRFRCGACKFPSHALSARMDGVRPWARPGNDLAQLWRSSRRRIRKPSERYQCGFFAGPGDGNPSVI
jgi:hypothetical protein